MRMISDRPFDTMNRELAWNPAPVTGIYRAPDGTHYRFKAKAALPDGYELVRATDQVADAPADPDEREGRSPKAKQAPEPENKAERVAEDK